MYKDGIEIQLKKRMEGSVFFRRTSGVQLVGFILFDGPVEEYDLPSSDISEAL